MYLSRRSCAVINGRGIRDQVQSAKDFIDIGQRGGLDEKDGMKGVIKGFPLREDLTMPMQEQLIVELYSK